MQLCKLFLSLLVILCLLLPPKKAVANDFSEFAYCAQQVMILGGGAFLLALIVGAMGAVARRDQSPLAPTWSELKNKPGPGRGQDIESLVTVFDQILPRDSFTALMSKTRKECKTTTAVVQALTSQLYQQPKSWLFRRPGWDRTGGYSTWFYFLLSDSLRERQISDALRDQIQAAVESLFRLNLKNSGWDRVDEREIIRRLLTETDGEALVEYLQQQERDIATQNGYLF